MLNKLTDRQLQDELASLQNSTSNAKQSLRVQHELEVHQIELEMQNRALREAEHELEASRDRYVDLYDFAPVGYLSFNPKGIVRELNLTAAEMLGTERFHVVGHPFIAWLPAGEAGVFFEHLRETASHPGAQCVTELNVKKRGGAQLVTRLVSMAEPAAAGACRTVITDITEARHNETIAREREAELAHLARVSTLGAMASMIAHETSQPLSAIINYAAVGLQAMKGSPQDQACVINSLEKIMKLSSQASDIVHMTRDFSKKGDAGRRPVDINDVVRNTTKLITGVARKTDTELVFLLAEGLPQVMANEVQIQQVVANLITNAIEAIGAAQNGDRRQVTVSTTVANAMVQLSVEDRGCGLPPEAAKRMFEAFYSTKPEGHGIGLSLSRTIINSHGGKIWAAPNQGSGTTVSFALPALRQGLAEATGESAKI
jgi:two-component system sensor kinase FixL